MPKKLTKEEFIKRAKAIHGDKYDYSLVEYENSNTKIKIICKKHGIFEQRPNNHLNLKQGCPRCDRYKGIERFITDAYCVHDDRYNYGLVEYKNAKTKVKIICPVHGVFEQRPDHHLNGHGCRKCANKNNQKFLSDSIDDFIEKSKIIHGNRYDYSDVIYKNQKTLVKIICPIHGVFEQLPDSHLHGCGCPKCACIISKQETELQKWIEKIMPKKLTINQFINRAKSVHGDKYDYSLVKYVDGSTKIKIICPEHGIFEQRPPDHLRGHGCKKCQYNKLHNNKRKTTDQFIIDAYCKHGDRYNYKLVDYKNAKTKVKIICHEHGIFEQVPSYHLSGNGCPECGIIRDNKGVEYYIKLAKKVHGDKYDYSLINNIISSYDKVNIICPIHGVFEQRMNNHIHRMSGCPKCASHISKQETELQEWLKDDIDVVFNDRSLISPYELDIVIPSHKIAIEYNGLYWHSETVGKDRKYHLNKYNLCKEKGYRLIQIWENEWLLTPDIVKSFLLSAIGIYKYKIGARQTSIQKISSKKARQFYNDNHLQGFQSGIHHGLIYDNELVSLMTIKKYKTGNMLERFVNKKYYQIYGSFSKLLNSFNINDDLYTFADIRHFTGDVYYKCGFKYVHTTKPNYWYFKNNSIIVYHRRHFQKKNIKRRFENGELKHFNPDKTEYQNMIDNGFHRIWDCGNIKFIRKCK